jgi:hypothetical protein
MQEISSLGLPILLSAIAVFVASFLAWVVIGHHTPDWNELPDEEATITLLQKSGAKAGQYMFPMMRSKEQMADESKQRRMDSGPWGTVNIWARPVNMGRNLLQTFVFYLVASFFVGYLGTLALDPGASFSRVFQVTGTAGILAYAFGGVPNAIWFGTHFRSAIMDVIDGICFGLITGLVFASMWPAA